jgi:hypothetical protein
MIYLKYFFALIILFNTLNSFALDIDEKLTIRFLKVSNSKKTVLINRGAEDGLVVGDHAKFFITSGIVARGMVEKVSPSRSIWSIYRIVSNEDIVDNKVLNLKIASPVKVTNDPTKSLKEETTIEGEDKIAVPKELDEVKSKSDSEKNDSKMDEKLNEEDKKELEDMGIKEKETVKPTKSVKNELEIPVEKVSVKSTNMADTWETFGSLSMSALSGTVSGDNTASSTSVSSSVFDLSIGLEKYFFTSDVMKNISLFGIINKKSVENGDSAKTTTDWLNYGGGVNYHFYNPPQAINEVIGFGSFSAGIGTVAIKEKTVVGASATETNTDGSTKFFSLGVGIKYITSINFGARALIDYYSSGESFTYADGSTSTRSLSGPRLQLGVSYRF